MRFMTLNWNIYLFLDMWVIVVFIVKASGVGVIIAIKYYVLIQTRLVISIFIILDWETEKPSGKQQKVVANNKKVAKKEVKRAIDTFTFTLPANKVLLWMDFCNFLSSLLSFGKLQYSLTKFLWVFGVEEAREDGAEKFSKFSGTKLGIYENLFEVFSSCDTNSFNLDLRFLLAFLNLC